MRLSFRFPSRRPRSGPLSARAALLVCRFALPAAIPAVAQVSLPGRTVTARQSETARAPLSLRERAARGRLQPAFALRAGLG
jgi:hypothetical protein